MNSSFPCKFRRNFFLRNNRSYTRISPSKSTNGSLPQRDSLFTFGIPQPRFSRKATFDSFLQTVWYFPSRVKRCHFSSKKIIQNLPADRKMIPQRSQQMVVFVQKIVQIPQQSQQ